MAPLLKLLIILGCIAIAVAMGLIFGLPAIEKAVAPPEPTATITPNEFRDPVGVTTDADIGDLSALQQEAVILENTANEPYLFGSELIFSSARAGSNGVHAYKKLFLYDATATSANEATKEVPGIEVKYENICQPKLNENYIVWADSHAAGGGRLCMYDRAAGRQYAIKEYAYAMPQFSLYGNLIAFAQQAGDNTVKLYLFNLETRECVTMKRWEELPAPMTPVHLSDAGVTYAAAYTENDVIMSYIYVQSLDGSIRQFDAGRMAYYPKSCGEYTAFLSSVTGAPSDLYLSRDSQMPTLIESDVLTYDMGDGFLAYTKDGNVYIYVLKNGKRYRLNTDISLGYVSSVNGNQVTWYDVTSGYANDIVKFANVTFEE